MENSLILCGGTGAHAAAAFLRLHTLGSPLGFFQHEGRPLDFPNLYLVDQDSKDAAGNKPTAWQFTRSLLTSHPARHDWQRFIGRAAAPEMVQATPLPVGPEKNWSDRPHNSLRTRFESSPYLDLVASDYQKDIDYQKGMMGSPAMGSLLFRLKEHDESARGLNHDLMYGQILDLRGRVVVAGSGVGGTGASVGPTLAERLVSRGAADVMAVMILNWFEFVEEEGSDEIQAKAQRRNRLMKENANSALEYYGRNLAQAVAAVPVGMPEGSLVKRVFTGDVSQPITESFIHAVAALCGYRHFCNPQPYAPGLYMMGAVERGRLDGRTDIPGGTLQSLANQAATLADLTGTWCRVLSSEQSGRVQPAIYQAVRAASSSPRQVAEHLQHEVDHYQEQLRWLKDTLGVEGTPYRALTTEARSRQRLATRGLSLEPDTAPDAVAGALFHWTADWVQAEARLENNLLIAAAPVGGGQWPDLHKPDGLGVTAQHNGDLDRISDADAVLEAFVDPKKISVNGWPHPLAAADYFRFAIQRRDEVALRQLEMLLLGVVTGVLEIRPTMEREPAPVSLESLAAEYRRDGWEAVFAFEVTYPERGGRVIGFNSPHTLLAPVPFLSDEEETWLWDGLWKQLSGVKDGAFWSEAAKAPWDSGDTVQVRQIRAWIEKEKSRRTGTAPGWTRVFGSVKVDPAQVPYGVGTPLQVYWGAPGDATRGLVRLSLPTSESDEWTPPADTPLVAAEDLLEQIPNLLAVSDASGRRFEHVTFRSPGGGTFRGWWREHLDQLRKDGQIHVWSWDKDRAVTLGWMEGENLKAVRIQGSKLLDVSELKIPSLVPLAQDPVPGSALRPGVKYPDLPLKVEYLDLLQTAGGHHWLKEAAAGTIKVSEGLGRPVERAGVVGASAVSWKLRLRGRSDEVPMELNLEAEDQPVSAHWLVWPSFRAPREVGWKSYYIYEYTELVDASLDVVWVNEVEAEPQVRLLSMPRRRGGHELKAAACPIDFEEGAGGGARKGGPPLAVALKLRGAREAGIYLVPLQKVGTYSAELHLGIDFGTSHSSAAVAKSPSAPPEPVSLAPELALPPNKKALTLSLSEAWKRISDSPAGIFGQHGWMPTYRATGGGFLPSELLLSNTLENVQAQDIREWVPGLDFMIPPTDMGRGDLSKHILTDFKWDAGSVHFHGREGQLREHYLSLLLELVLADVVVNHTNGAPIGDVSTTFTYPLRAKDQQVAALQSSFQGALARAKSSTGLKLRMLDGIGMFDESRAARVSSNLEGEVTLVADLGGGTLDVFVMAAEAGKVKFPEVADSARIGGNLLLRQIAESPEGILPAAGNWQSNGSRDTETKLRAWMRTLGAPKLFGTDAGDSPSLQSMEVVGFRLSADGDRARRLIDRYLRLLTEYLARYLAGYLYTHWYPKAPEESWNRLRLAVQLRGNGWKLSYRKGSHETITREVQDAIRERVKLLWNLLPGNEYPNPFEAAWADPSMHAQEDPKTVTVKGVVGKAMSHEEVKDRWNSHTLVDLEVLHDAGDRSTFGWYESIPLDTRSSKQVEVRTIRPPVVVSSPFEDVEVSIEELDMASHGGVQAKLKDTDSQVDPGRGTYTAPVAPILWEAMFDSKAFWPER